MSDRSEPDMTRSLETEEAGLDKIPVEALRVRDRVVLQTSEGPCVVTVGKNNHCILGSGCPSVQSGQIILRGGTNAEITEYTPNRIYVGGRLAYVFEEEAPELLTTPVIESLSYEPALR